MTQRAVNRRKLDLALLDACENFRRYKGARRPSCGCPACNNKFNEMEAQRAAARGSSVV